MSLLRILRLLPDLTASIPNSSVKYLSHYAQDELAIPIEDLLAMGRQNRDDDFGILQHGLARGPQQRPDQWRQQAPRAGEPAYLSATFPAMATDGDSDWLCHQRHSCAHLGLGGGGCALDHSVRQEALAGDRPVEDDIRH
jgi:hypothetical protein